MGYIKIKNVELNVEALKSVTMDEAVELFKNINPNIVIEGWKAVNPEEKPKRKRKSRSKIS